MGQLRPSALSIPLVSETLAKTIVAVESAGQFTGRQVMVSQQWGQGNALVTGQVQHEMYDQSMGMLLAPRSGP